MNTDLAPAPTGEQLHLIDLAEFDGFGSLSRREQEFAQAIFEGLTQRAAAARAGVTGSPEVLDQAGHSLMRNAKVQRLLAQAWNRSGASIHRTLAQAAELQQRAFAECAEALTAERREKAFKQWQAASALVASIHGKLSVRVEGDVNHHHSGSVGSVVVPASALIAFAHMHREVVVDRLNTVDLQEGAA